MQRWSYFLEIRKEFAGMIYKVFDKVSKRKHIPNIRTQKDRLARRLTPCIVDLITSHGEIYKVPDPWVGEFPMTTAMLNPGSKDENNEDSETNGNLLLVIRLIFDTVIHQHQKGDPIDCVALSVGPAFSSQDLQNKTLDALNLGCLFTYTTYEKQKKKKLGKL